MAIPKQVDETAELAEQLHEKMFNQQASPEVDDTPEEIEDEVVENVPDTDDEDSDVPHDDDLEELRKFKSRYMHLKGKYDAEVPRLHQELREFKSSVFERLEQQVQKPVASPAPEVDPYSELAEQYGDEFVEALKKVVSYENKKTVQPIQEHISQVEDTQTSAAQANFVNYINSKVNGDWTPVAAGYQELLDGRIPSDPKVAEFLSSPDPSGLYTYAELIHQFNTKWDGDKLSRVFNLYLESTSEPEPPPVKKQPRPEQQAMVAPSRSTSNVAPQSNDKLIWTNETMKEFQAAERAGKYTPEQAQAMWNDLLAAPSEGRFR